MRSMATSITIGGIYPPLSTFVKTILVPKKRKRKEVIALVIHKLAWWEQIHTTT
jgi:hypothetical protein